MTYVKVASGFEGDLCFALLWSSFLGTRHLCETKNVWAPRQKVVRFTLFCICSLCSYAPLLLVSVSLEEAHAQRGFTQCLKQWLIYAFRSRCPIEHLARRVEFVDLKCAEKKGGSFISCLEMAWWCTSSVPPLFTWNKVTNCLSGRTPRTKLQISYNSGLCG